MKETSFVAVFKGEHVEINSNLRSPTRNLSMLLGSLEEDETKKKITVLCLLIPIFASLCG